VVRARQFEDNKLPGSIEYRSYLINERVTLPVISIMAEPGALWDDFKGIYERRMKAREIPVSIDFFHPDQESTISFNAGLRLTGQASLYYPQVSFTLYARDRYGPDEIPGQMFAVRKLNSIKSLYLRNAGVPDHRSTFFRDALQHTLVRDKIDIDCQAYQPSLVFLNGVYWGIYNIRDKINVDYLAAIHNINPEAIDLLEYELGSSKPVVMEGNAENYTLFYNYIQDTDLSVEEHYRLLEEWMDMDEFINYQICEIFYDNMFWPDQNVRMWRERKEGAKWRWILFDTDYGFGMPNGRSSGYTNNTLAYATSSNTTGVEAPEWSTLIFRKLLANSEFKTRFIQRFDASLNSVFHPDAVLPVIGHLEEQIAPEMSRHIERWRSGEWYYGEPIQSYGEWRGNVDVMKNFARHRPGYQRKHISDYFQLEGSAMLRVSVDPPGSGKVRINGIVEIDSSASGLFFKNVPLELDAISRVGYRFVGWEGVGEDSTKHVELLLDRDTVDLTALFDTVNLTFAPSVLGSDTSFLKSRSPYYATGDIIVPPNTTLSIEAGVELYMPKDANFLVNGSLFILGTQEESVKIAPNRHAQNWGALCFINATDSSAISHLNLSGTTRGPVFHRDRAAISGYFSDFSLYHVNISDAALPVFVQGGNVSIRGCSLRSGMAGDLINVKSAESAIVEDCDLRGNAYFDSDGIDYDEVSNGIIRGNRIYNFYGSNSDAIDLGEGSRGILIENNMIYNVNDKGVSIGNGSTANIKRNLFANCGQGAGIKDSGSYAYMENNTFSSNTYGIACFEKNIGRGGGNAALVNGIIADCRMASVFVDKYSSLDLSYSLVNKGQPAGLHNIYDEPGFANNFQLTVNSPAINSGNPTLPRDPDGSLPDMGTFPFEEQQTPDLRITEIHYHPEEGKNYEFIEILNAGSSAAELTGMELSGDIRYFFPDETISPGELFLLALDRSLYQGKGFKVFQWDKGELKDGAGSIFLSDRQGNTIDFVNYDSRYWWPREADGSGLSLELHDEGLENMVSSNWRSSYSHGGTPGRSSRSEFLSGIYINEFMASNNAVIADEYGDYNDWIELYNASDQPINVAGLYVTDDLSNPFKYRLPLYDLSSTVIPAEGFLLLWADGETEEGVLHLGFRLDQAGESIGLVQSNEGSAWFLDSLSYGNQDINRSYGRYPDGSELHHLSEPTPLGSNIYTAARDWSAVFNGFTLFQNHPNPINTKTTITFQLTRASEIELHIYDLYGRRVTTLVKGYRTSGIHQVEWVPGAIQSGIYFCELKTRQGRQVIKMIWTR
jgi:hypothetical protein